MPVAEMSAMGVTWNIRNGASLRKASAAFEGVRLEASLPARALRTELNGDGCTIKPRPSRLHENRWETASSSESRSRNIFQSPAISADPFVICDRQILRPRDTSSASSKTSTLCTAFNRENDPSRVPRGDEGRSSRGLSQLSLVRNRLDICSQKMSFPNDDDPDCNCLATFPSRLQNSLCDHAAKERRTRAITRSTFCRQALVRFKFSAVTFPLFSSLSVQFTKMCIAVPELYGTSGP